MHSGKDELPSNSVSHKCMILCKGNTSGKWSGKTVTETSWQSQKQMKSKTAWTVCQMCEICKYEMYFWAWKKFRSRGFIFFYSKSFVTLSISKHDQYSHFVIYKSTIKNLTLKLNSINEVVQSNQGEKQSCWFSFQVICHFFSHQTLTWIYILTGIHCQEPRNGVQLEEIITNTVHTVNVNKWKTVKVYFWLTAL